MGSCVVDDYLFYVIYKSIFFFFLTIDKILPENVNTWNLQKVSMSKDMCCSFYCSVSTSICIIYLLVFFEMVE